MSRNYCNNNSPCGNPFSSPDINSTGFGNPSIYTLLILSLVFGGGCGPESFWGPYKNIYLCSGFNSAWCNSFIGNNPLFNNSAGQVGSFFNSSI